MIAGILPEHITHVAGNEQLFDSVCKAKVEVNENLGAELIVHVTSGDERLTVRLMGTRELPQAIRFSWQ